MHAKTDSDVTSQTASSPTRSPPRQNPVYYVQSPRDSHDGADTKTTLTATNSFGSTPVLSSPMGSPPHSSHHSSLIDHPTSRDSSSSARFSGSVKTAGSRNGSGRRKGIITRMKPWKQFDAIEEEGLLGEDEMGGGLPRRFRYFLVFVVGFISLFTLFSLILLAASSSQKPVITMKSIAFESFVIQAGMDGSGVATDMVSMNSTVKLTFRNTATFFGVHVTSTPLSLSFSQLALSTGTINKFYQSRKRQRSITVEVKGSQVPVYGVAGSLSSYGGSLTAPVPLTLNFMVRSKAYVLGRLVKPKFNTRVLCNVVMDPIKMNVAISLKKLCNYYQ